MSTIIKTSILATAILLTSNQVAAQKIYKCKDSSGVTVYQQVPCSGDDGEVVKIQAQPSEATIAEAQSRLNAQNAAAARRRYEQAAQTSHQTVEFYDSSPSRSYASQPSSTSAQKALNPSRFDPERVGFSSSKGYETLRHSSSSGRSSRRVQDQYGNNYLKLQTRSVVIDEKTGRPCHVAGNTVHCN